MSLFDALEDNFHICGMDNLYNSAAFCKHAYMHERKVKVHGVTRKGMRGIPKCVAQEEQKNKKLQILAQGTVKVAVLRGDEEVGDLVATSIYDSKPVHFLSMVCKSLKWKEKERIVYNVETGMKETMKFLRMDYIDNYNMEMGDVDIADQYRNVYRFDHWLRQRKWWWSIFLGGLGVILVNSYIVYLQVCRQEGVEKRNILSHHDFRKKVAMAWINPDLCWTEEHQGSVRTHWNKRKLHHPSIASFTDRTSPPNKKLRAAKLSDEALGPKGFLSVRLDTTKQHFPECAKGNARCSLHKWVGIETQAQVSHCSTCNVNLCKQCFKLFHVCNDLVKEKQNLRRKYLKAKKPPRNTDDKETTFCL